MIYSGVSIDQAWINTLRSLRHMNPCSVAPRGIPLAKEDIGAQVAVWDSKRCVLTHPKRHLGYRFMLAEMLWILTGCDKVEPMLPFSRTIHIFSDDGKRFFGAYGTKIMSQINYVISVLRRDLHSRQAVINIWRENPPRSRDIPCTTTCQFLYREGKLHIVVTMRSSDVWLGLPYDCFNFCNLLHLVAADLGVLPGSYLITMGSLHLYEKNVEESLSVLANRDTCPVIEWHEPDFLRRWVDTGPKGDELNSSILIQAVDQLIKETQLSTIVR